MLQARALGKRVAVLEAPANLPLDPNDRSVLRYWFHYEKDKWADRMTLLDQICHEAQPLGWRMRVDSGWSPWDLELYLSRYVTVRILTASEQHAKGVLTRVKVNILMSTLTKLLVLGSSLLMVLLLAYVWPFSRPAVLLPFLLVALYLLNNARVTGPVMALIDRAASKNGLVPVPSSASSSVTAGQDLAETNPGPAVEPSPPPDAP